MADRPFADGERQIQAFYIRELPDLAAAVEWAHRLPTYGYVEVRELLQYWGSGRRAVAAAGVSGQQVGH